MPDQAIWPDPEVVKSVSKANREYVGDPFPPDPDLGSPEEDHSDFTFHVDLSDSWPSRRNRYIFGYKDAADRLLEYLRRARHGSPQSDCVYPLCFLYRHWLELELKNAICMAQRALGREIRWPSGHVLSELWRKYKELCREISEKLGREICEDSSEEMMEKCVLEFDRIDPKGQAFRYDVQRDGTISVSEFTDVDLQGVREMVEYLSCLLWGGNDMMHEMIQAQDTC